MTIKTYNSTAYRLYGFGYGTDSNLFQTGRTWPHKPYRVGSQTFTQVAGTSFRLFALDTNGYLYYWGRKNSPLTSDVALVPQLIDSNAWTKIIHSGSSGYNGFAWGIKGGNLYKIELSNTQTLIQTAIAPSIPNGWTDMDARGDDFFGIRGGQLYYWTTAGTPALKFSTTSDFVEIKREGGSAYFLARRTGGQVYRFDSNTSTLPSTWTTGVAKICDHAYSASGHGVIKTNGDLFVWGANSVGELGLGNNTSQSTPVFSRANVSNAMFDSNQSYIVTTANAVLAAGNIYRWPDGRNVGTALTSWTSLTLGIADTPSKFLPVAQGSITGLLCTNGNYYQWLQQSVQSLVYAVGKSGVYLTDNPFSDYTNPLNQATLGTVIDSTANWKAVCDSGTLAIWAINGSGELYTWGSNEQGHCLTGNYNWVSTPTKYGTDTDWHNVNFPYALKPDGKLYKFDSSTLGLTQLGSTLYRDIPNHGGGAYEPQYAVKFDGTFWYSDTSALSTQIGTDTDWDCMVRNSYQTLAKKTSGAIYKQSGASPTNFVLFDSGNYTSIALGSVSTTTTGAWAVKSDGTLWQWGTASSSPSQVGSETTWVSVQTTDVVILAINSYGEVWAAGNAYQNGASTSNSTLTKVANAPYAKEILTYGELSDSTALPHTKNSYIGYTIPTSSFTIAPTTGTTIELTNTSTNATNYLVDWGDGTTSTVASNRVTGAPGITPKLTHTYTLTSDSKFTVTLTAYGGSALSSTSTQTTTQYVTQSPTFTVVASGTGPSATFLNTSPNTLGATSVFGSGNKWRWEWDSTGTVYTDVDVGSGLPGSRNVAITHVFAFTGPEIVAAVPVTRTVKLKAYNGHASSPFSSATATVTLDPLNPTFPNVEFLTDTSVPDIINAPNTIIWGKA